MGRISPAGHASGLTIRPPGNASAIGLSLGRFSCVGGLGVMGACWSLKGMKRKTWWRLFAKASRDEQRGIAEMAEALRCKSMQLT